MKRYISQLSFSFIMLFYATLSAQTIDLETSGSVNFNLQTAPKLNYGSQEISLYGCDTDTAITLEWGLGDQVLSEVPYGPRTKGEKKYYISRYYMASPPVMKMPYDGGLVNIGLVLPDHFTFFGEKPVQMVQLDYSLLKPVYLNYVKANYTYNDSVHPTCDSLGVNLVPINIECDDFPWQDKPTTPTIFGAKGASGVGRLRNETNQNQVFLPSLSVGNEYLNCNIRVLDDILLEHEVFFVNGDSLVKSIRLTDYYTDKSKIGTEIQLACRVRTEIPAGCK